MVIASMITMLALSGCVQIDVSSEFDSDGSGVHALSTTLDQSMVDDEMLGGELDFEEIEENAANVDGVDAERIEDGDRVGIRISTEVEDNEDLGAALNELLTAMDPEAPTMDAFSGSFTESGGLGGTTYEFELTVNGDELFDDGSDELDDEMDMEFDANMMRQFIDLTYTISMPGEISDHNGTEIDGNQVQWELPFEGSSTFSAESEEGGGLSFALIIGIGTGTLALLLLAVGGIFLLRSRSTPARQSAPTSGTTAD